MLLPEAKVVRRIYDELVHEQKSIGEIVRGLNADGIPTRRGASRWDRTTVWGSFATRRTWAKPPTARPRWRSGAGCCARSAAGLGFRAGARAPTATSRRSSGSTSACPPSCRRRSSPLRTLNWSETSGSRSEMRAASATCCKVSSSAAAAGTLTTARPCRSRLPRAGAGTPTTAASAPTPSASPAVASAPTGRCARTSSTTTFWESVRHVLEDPDRVIQEWTRRSASDRGQDERRAQRDEAASVLASHERSHKRLLDAYEAGALELKELTERSERLRPRIRACARGAQQGGSRG